jgi:four helix bundle protein
MAIASKEAREAEYWIDLLIKTDYLNSEDDHTKSLLREIEEIIKLLISIVKTSQENK